MKKYSLLLVCLAACLVAVAQYQYPPGKMEDSTDTYFGVTYHDPYRWMEHMDRSEVSDWFRAQANYSNSIIGKLNGRDELVAEWLQLDRMQPARIRNVMFEGGRLFYRKTMPGEKVGKLYYREGLKGKEILLFDPSAYIPGVQLTLSSGIPSFDGKKVAISYTRQGAEVDVIKVLDVDTRRFLTDSIYPSAGFSTWSFDNKSFSYIWLQSADNKDPNSRLNPKCKMHQLGNLQQNDIDYFSNASYPELNIDPGEYPFVFVTKDAPDYVFSAVSSVQNEFIYYSAPVTEMIARKINWKPLARTTDKLVRSFAIIGNTAYAITYDGAKNYKLVAAPVNNPDWKNATVIAAEKPDQTLESFTNCRDYLIIVHSDGINNHLSKYNIKTKQTTQVTLPFSGTVDVSVFDTKTNTCRIGITSWIKPYTEFDFDAATGAFTPGFLNKPPVIPAKYKDLEVKEVEVKGHDGVMIPLSIIYKKGTKPDGSSTCLLDAYGAYGISAAPWFNSQYNSLAVRGVVIGIPHVRGGSEKGEDWYRAGYKTTKPNTWKDFISCAEYMIAQGYTSKGRIAGTGTSAGGILISRAITERPDLFAAAICNVGCANAMRLEFGANGPVNVPEFGTVTDSVECRALFEMDGMQHVRSHTAYPAVLCVAGWNDSRVIAWQPGKFAAALQNSSNSGKPVLMKVNYDNGHFTEDKAVTFANFADQFAFALWQCGHTAFQPK